MSTLNLFSFPKVVRIEPASQCNLSCSHCPTGTVDMNRGIMKQSCFNKTTDYISKYKEYIEVIVLYHGGEPLLNKNIYDYIKKLKKIKNEVFIKTVTNGMVLNKKNSQKILDSGLDLIEISLDGESKNESQNIRKKSKSDLIIENLKYLIQLKKDQKKTSPKICVSTTQFLKESDDNPINESPPVPNWLIELFSSDVEYKSTYALEWPHMGSIKDNYTLKVFDEDRESNYCDHVNNLMTIRSNGDVVACCYDLTSKLVMGNIMTDDPLEIWNNSKYKDLRESIESKKFKSICSNCAVVKPNKYLIKKSLNS
tara:strand:- start:102 stop:1034 length:933 start_codon:yes stop_codon:yes gene_type:complete